MTKKKLSSALVLLLVAAVLHACGNSEETCTCTCTCGSGQKSTIKNTKNEDDCANQCDTKCGDDSYTTNYDCTTRG